jgi:hypothetical protein
MYGVGVRRPFGLTERFHERGIVTIHVKAAVRLYSGYAVPVSHLGRGCCSVLDFLGSRRDLRCEPVEDLGSGEAAHDRERLGQCPPVVHVLGQRRLCDSSPFHLAEASRGADEQPLSIAHRRDYPLAGRDGPERRRGRRRGEDGILARVMAGRERGFFVKALLGVREVACDQRLDEVDTMIIGVMLQISDQRRCEMGCRFLDGRTACTGEVPQIRERVRWPQAILAAPWSVVFVDFDSSRGRCYLGRTDVAGALALVVSDLRR